MPSAIPDKVRQEAVAAYLEQKGTIAQVAAQYGMSAESLGRFVARHRYAEGTTIEAPRRGRAPTYDAEEMALLRTHATSHRQASTAELRQFMAQRTGKSVSRSTMEHLLRMLGLRRVRPSKSTKPARTRSSTPTRYTDAHRRDEPDRYPTDLTDAEWALLEAHFQPRGGRPPEHTPRRVLDAIFYVLRSGCPWRMLPHDFPPWKTVYTAFRRWNRDGRLRAAHEALRRKLRQRMGRNDDPSALIVDSQSVKTTEKGGLAATTPARR